MLLFKGEKCIGYNVLYDNMKKGEETVQEFVNFLKERIGMEEDILKCLGKNLNKVYKIFFDKNKLQNLDQYIHIK